MRRLNEVHGKTFLFSTHDPMVMTRAKRVITFHDGGVAKDEKRSASKRSLGKVR
jgi:putative ABC transport system ATP-binding protein